MKQIHFYSLLGLFIVLCLTGCSSVKNNILNIKDKVRYINKYGMDLPKDYYIKREGKYLYISHPNTKAKLGYNHKRAAIIFKFNTEF